MYKKNKDQEKRYRVAILIVIVIMFPVKQELIRFFNRDDLTEYVQSHQSEVSGQRGVDAQR
jgi:hypothetical protein